MDVVPGTGEQVAAKKEEADFVDLMVRFHKSGKIEYKLPSDPMMLSYLYMIIGTKVNDIFKSMTTPSKILMPGQMDKKNFFKKVFCGK